jgi:hypothetical protein
MSPAKESSNERDQIQDRLAGEARSAKESYRSTQEQYLNVRNGFEATPDVPQAVQSIYSAAKDVRMARKRYRRATRVLTGFTASA